MPSITSIIRRRQARELAAQRGTQQALRVSASVGLSVAAGALLTVLAVGWALVTLYAYFTKDLPPAEALQAAFNPLTSDFFQTTKIYDRTGQHLLYEIIDPRGGDRQYLPYGELPLNIISATVAIEDKTFFTNPGYDPVGIARALVSNLQGGQVQGGSSITQQLVKNTLIPLEQRTERSYDRKIREILLAAEITRLYDKEQILEWYLNTNFYGNLAYGADAAALVYFGKHATNLTLAEAALLAAIPQSPGLNPFNAPEDARARQAVVLNTMLAEGFITPAQALAARTETLVFQPPAQRFDIQAPHFAVMVRQQLVAWFGEDVVNRGGLQVITTLDLDLQHQTECAARTQLARLGGAAPDAIVPAEGATTCEAAQYLPPLKETDSGVDHRASNTAVVVIRPGTGEVLALLGSADYWNAEISGNFNIAADGQRQPGSSFKPFTYIEAFRQGYAPASMMLDVPTAFQLNNGQVYLPENYDRKFHGPVSLRVALARSYNIPAVDLIQKVGVDNVVRLSHRLGINSLELGQYNLALTLGGGEVTLLDLTYAYSVLANNGIMAGLPIPTAQQRPGYRTLDPVTVLRVTDRNSNVLYQLDNPPSQPILSPELAYLITNVLSDNEARVAAFGAGNPLELPDRPAAAKTGTTNDFRDNWTMGYVPQLAIGVWVGNANNAPMQNVSGLTGAAPLWHALMVYGVQHYQLPPQGWEPPATITQMRVCDPSGLLPTAECQRTKDEVFAQGTEPLAADNIWVAVALNRETGKRATACTPPELVEKKYYQLLPPEAQDWARDVGWVQPPADYDTFSGACLATGNALIAAPQPFAYVRGQVPIFGTAKGDNFAFYRLQVGPGLYPANWTQIEGDRGEQIDNNLLLTWDTTGLNGLYSLQLVVVKNDPAGGPPAFEVATTQVTVDNQPPTISLLTPANNTEFEQADETIVIQPQVADNLSVARVVLYVDSSPIDSALAPPYSFRWNITGLGPHTLQVRVYDAAGNFADSERIGIVVK